MKISKSTFTVQTIDGVILNVEVDNSFQDISIAYGNIDGTVEFTPAELHKNLNVFCAHVSDRIDLWQLIFNVANEEMRSKIWDQKEHK